MYSPGDAPTKFRTYAVCAMEIWHTLKMAYHLVYRHWAMEFFAPLFHHSVPGHEFFPEPNRLIRIQRVFANLRLAYGQTSVKEAFKAALHVDEDSARTGQQQLLQNLKDICEYFIPAVSESACVVT
jgi:hypothetical protein